MQSRPPFLRRHWPFLLAEVVWLALFAVTLAQILANTGGRMVYASDDVYIHMAIAKNLVLHGVWGVTPFGFTSCASSIIWPLVIAFTYVLFGVNEWSPILLNLLLSLAVLAVVYRFLRGRGRGDLVCAAVLLALVLCIPMTAISFDGMEHMLQILVFVVFTERLFFVLNREPGGSWDLWLPILACGLTLVRYEGLFLAGAAVMLLAWKKQWKLCAAVVVGAALPVAGMAAISLAHGWYPIPNSVLIKSAPFTDIIPESPIQTLTRPFRYLSGRDYILSLVVLLLLSWLATVREVPRRDLFRRLAPGAFFLMVVFAHGTLIDMEWFYRHAAYLLMLGIITIEMTWPAGGLRWRWPASGAARLAISALAVFLAYPLCARASGAILDTPLAARNIYEMQYQMARFLNRYYPEGPVAANDIGAVSYYNDFSLLDLYGLASMDVARAKLGGTYDTALIDRLTRESGAQVMIVYDYWFDRYGGLPKGWVKAGEWHYTDCYVCGGDTVSFYAPSAAQADSLRAELDAFREVLPARVKYQRITGGGFAEDGNGG
ncbi:MAG: hypothetical protein ABSC61_01415 [Anaerolineales bacterium]